MGQQNNINCTVMSIFGLTTENDTSTDFDSGHIFGRTLSFWVNGIFTMCLIIVGVVGNVAIVISLACNTKKWLALYYYFMAFAVWNTSLLVSTVFVYTLPALGPDETEVSLSGFEDFINLSLIGYGIGNCGMTASIWLVLSLTVERYMAVIKPLHLFSSKPKRRARFVVAAISLLAPIYNIPLFFELQVVRTATGEVDVAKTGLRDHPLYKIAYRIVGNAAFLSVVPLLSIVVMSMRIVYVVRTLTNEDRYNYFNEGDHEYNLIDPHLNVAYYDRRRSSLSRCHSTKIIKQNTHRTHVTLAALATKFVLCYTLPTLLNILEIAVEPYTLTQCGMAFLVDVSNFMVVFDSAMNGFIYFSWRRNLANYYRKQQTPVVFAKLTLPGASVGGSTGTHLSPGGISDRRNTVDIASTSRRNSARSVCSLFEKVSSL